jgi:hypothetical protein
LYWLVFIVERYPFEDKGIGASPVWVTNVICSGMEHDFVIIDSEDKISFVDNSTYNVVLNYTTFYPVQYIKLDFVIDGYML